MYGTCGVKVPRVLCVVEVVVEGGLFKWAERQPQGWVVPLLVFSNGHGHSWSEWKLR